VAALLVFHCLARGMVPAFFFCNEWSVRELDKHSMIRGEDQLCLGELRPKDMAPQGEWTWAFCEKGISHPAKTDRWICRNVVDSKQKNIRVPSFPR
jgi:hypothetical protein